MLQSRANSSSRSHMLERGWERDRDTEGSVGTLTRHHRRQGSAATTPTPSRPASRRSSPHPPPAPSLSPSHSSLSSSKTVINTKAMSSASSGYNSLPRSSKSPKTSRQSSATNTPKSSPSHSATSSGMFYSLLQPWSESLKEKNRVHLVFDLILKIRIQFNMFFTIQIP